jgi:hypothetical protein
MGDLRTILRQPVVVPDSMTVLQTMEMFRKSRIHVAFVIDEYGTLEGFVTLTDVAEAIAGDLPEGHEQDDFTFEKAEDGSYLVSGGPDVARPVRGSGAARSAGGGLQHGGGRGAQYSQEAAAQGRGVSSARLARGDRAYGWAPGGSDAVFEGGKHLRRVNVHHVMRG